MVLVLTVSGNAMEEREEVAIREVTERAYVEGIHVLPEEAAIRAGFHQDFVMSANNDDGLLVPSLDEWHRSSLRQIDGSEQAAP